MRNPYIIILLALLFCIPYAKAQELISSAAEEHENSGYRISWSLGEPFIQTLSKNEIVLTQGYHQTKLKVTSVKNYNDHPVVKVYPNPAKEYIKISTESTEIIRYGLFRLSGEKIQEGEFLFPEDRLDMSKYNSGTYILMFYDSDDKIIQNMKIIKQ